MIRTVVKDGSLGYDKMRFVFQDAYDETSCTDGKSVHLRAQTKTRQSNERPAVVAGPEQAAAVKAGLPDGGERRGGQTKKKTSRTDAARKRGGRSIRNHKIVREKRKN